jgi:predicted CXXCH cytochrome family protein
MRRLIIIAATVAFAVSARGVSIVNSKHNLSTSGPGTLKAATETDVCIFCHTTHLSAPNAPLWNRPNSGVTYSTYNSSTLKATVGQPSGSSKLCLSCHDGTVALGQLRNRAARVRFQHDVTHMPSGASRLGTDLSGDHPVSFVFDNSVRAVKSDMNTPSALTGRVRLQNDRIECTTCHDPHDDRYGKFLVTDNVASALCLVCHNKPDWIGSSHQASTKRWNGSGPNPWPHSKYATVADNGCGNCHRSHTAGGKERLLNYDSDEANCFPCHNGNVATKNIQAEFNKASVHPIAFGKHDPMEHAVNSPRHVKCMDCHNPHATTSKGPVVMSKSMKSTVPGPVIASRAIRGVKGVTSAGTVVKQVTYEYELCYRCHADSINRGRARVTRQFVQTNTRRAFAESNLSYHPIQAPGRNANVPSLIAPWTTAHQMTCTDCHNNDQSPGANGTGPGGPHGSAYAPLLERQQILTDNTIESSTAYALCYKCHSRDSILSDQSFPHHRKHVVDQRTACTTCHDSHGVANATNLINFNTTYAAKSSNGRFDYTATGPRHGTCNLTCHNADHNNRSY